MDYKYKLWYTYKYKYKYKYECGYDYKYPNEHVLIVRICCQLFYNLTVGGEEEIALNIAFRYMSVRVYAFRSV